MKMSQTELPTVIPFLFRLFFFNLKISRLQNDRNKNGISFLRASTTDSSPHTEPLQYLQTG